MDQPIPKVALVMGSDSDYSELTGCIKILKNFGIKVVVRVLSAHRTPNEAAEFAEKATEEGFQVIIAAAGKAAHLAGAMAAHTTLPVIGIPGKSSHLGGIEALLSTVEMPKGIPVATVAIGGGENAAILATEMLALCYPDLTAKLIEARGQMRRDIAIADAEIQRKAAEL